MSGGVTDDGTYGVLLMDSRPTDLDAAMIEDAEPAAALAHISARNGHMAPQTVQMPIVLGCGCQPQARHEYIDDIRFSRRITFHSPGRRVTAKPARRASALISSFDCNVSPSSRCKPNRAAEHSITYSNARPIPWRCQLS